MVAPISQASGLDSSSSTTPTIRKDPLPMIAIVVGSMAGIAFLLAVMFLSLCYWRRKQRKAQLIAHPFLRRFSRFSAGLSIGEGVVSKDKFLPNGNRHLPNTRVAGNIVDNEGNDNTELPESQQTTIVNTEPDSPGEALKQENERLRAENELLRLMASGALPRPKNRK
ncbi:hypothetical protein H0H87_009533 [Tephrocybe sp. NHM501043]|nr:hypothetical protein H0H87_009533 [Tephrocybe sp. NHM501043]